MQSYVETSRASIQSLLAEINKKPVAIARKGNYMAFLTMPEAPANDTEYRADNGKCKGNSFWNDGTCQACSEDWKSHVCSKCGLAARSRTSYCQACVEQSAC